MSISTLCGMLTYAYFNELIIIKSPSQFNEKNSVIDRKITRTPVKLFFWRHNRWEIDKISLLFPENTQEQGLLIAQSWFYEANQTGFIKQTISVETALYDSRYNCLYISLSKSPFDHNLSTQETLSILESLLKTIHSILGSTVKYVHILINHKILEHPHIDCSHSFPITGFNTFNA